VARKPARGFGGKPHLPTALRQNQRLAPQFDALQRQFEDKVRLQVTPTGIAPEEVIVLETVGTIENFFSAAKEIQGMEWLAEWDEDEIPPDDDFFKDDAHKDTMLSGRLFLIMTNQQAMQRLLSMWQQYVQNPTQSFPHGLGKFRELFMQLRNVRVWGVQDRLIENHTLDYWKTTIAYAENQDVHTEIELWFRHNVDTRSKAAQDIRTLVAEVSGQIIQEATIAEIGYQALLAVLPAQYVTELIKNPDAKLVQSEHIMFFRPTGQTLVKLSPGDALAPKSKPVRAKPASNKPIVALLDGVPLENHELLSDRLIVDDPYQWSASCQAQDRNHGTAMASLICHGELDKQEMPLSSPLYVRPILRPDSRDILNIPRQEIIPDGTLAVDLIFQAFRRIFEGDGAESPVAPSVKVVNLSLGDSARPFESFVSPLARLLDWLAWHYKVLIVVSAGNCGEEVVIDTNRQSFSQLSADLVQERFIKSVAERLRHRRILSPAESINGLTVAASHADASLLPSDNRLNFYGDNMPSPMNTFGLGFRRSIKPEILAPGGRQLYRERITGDAANFIVSIDQSGSAPGQLVATPSPKRGVLDAQRYTRGTSNATAITTRAAAKLYDRILQWRSLPGGETLGEEHTAVLLKAMLIHGAYWNNAIKAFEAALKTKENSNKFREHAARFLGYGFLNEELSIQCNDERAVLIGTGELSNDDAHVFTLPLPESLSGKQIWRRLTITLAWLSPINCEHRGYRRAALWFEPPGTEIQIKRKEVDGKATMRGTVQHEVLDGYKAAAFKRGDSVQLQVNCRADAGAFEGKAPYALVVTLEVEPGSRIPIWEEIANAIRPAVKIQPST
jgi:hypothetical protein